MLLHLGGAGVVHGCRRLAAEYSLSAINASGLQGGLVVSLNEALKSIKGHSEESTLAL